HSYRSARYLHSFPTRRSSDLTFSENEEPMEVYASAFKDSIVLEGYANTEEHIVQLYAIDKSNNLSQPVSVTIQPLTPPISLIRQDRKSTRLNSSHVKISYAVF